MTASFVAGNGLTPLLEHLTPAPAVKARTTALPPIPQTGTLTFARAASTGLDATANIGDVGLSADTTRLSLTLDLQANRKYSFSFFFQTNGPKVTLTDANGNVTAVSMAKGFSVAQSGSYKLTFDAPYSLKTSAHFDNLAINAKSVLPTTSGDKNIDALLMGGTDEWWHAYDAAPTAGVDMVSGAALGLDANSSARTLTYSFLSSPPDGQAMSGFQEMTTAQKDAVRAAFDYYSKIINVTFAEVDGSGTGNINLGTNTQASSAGYANLPDSSGVKDKVYLYLANNQTTNNDPGMAVGGYGWMTALHEIGHTLGLKHPGNYNAGGGGTTGPYLPSALDNRQYSIMSYNDNNASRGVSPTTPMLYDVAALQYLYGANKSASTAKDGAFTFTGEPPTLQTLWSASGTDTIDLRGLANSSNVNLNAGTYSSINLTAPATTKSYSGNNNVALAFGSKINNVTLSSNTGVADTVTLNGAFATGGYDRIGSFDAAADKFVLKKSLFGALSAANVVVGTAATTSKTKIIVNNQTGDIYYDADGSGKGAAKKIAHYSTIAGGALSAGNFSFVA